MAITPWVSRAARLETSVRNEIQPLMRWEYPWPLNGKICHCALMLQNIPEFCLLGLNRDLPSKKLLTRANLPGNHLKRSEGKAVSSFCWHPLTAGDGDRINSGWCRTRVWGVCVSRMVHWNQEERSFHPDMTYYGHILTKLGTVPAD